MKMVNFGGCGPKLVNCLSGLGDPYKQQRMKVLKSVFDFYLDASIHVAMAVLSLAGVSFLLMGTIPDIKLLGFIFFSVIVGYNFIKYGVEAYKYLIVSNAYHKFIQAFSFVSFGFSLLFFLRLEVRLWLAIGALGLMSALYAVPFLPRAKNLRSLAGLKIHIVALVWAGFTVLLPAIDAHLPLDWDFWVLFIQRFLLVLVLIIPFEIRDLQWDDPGLRTLPQVLGAKNTRICGMVMALLFFLMTFLKDEIHKWELVLRFLLSVVLILMLLDGKRIRDRYFASFWVEAIPIFWFGAFFLVDVFF